MKSKKYSSKDLFALFYGHHSKLVLAMLLVVVSTVIATTMPLIFRELIDHAIPSKELSSIFTVATLYFLAVALASLFQLLQQLIVGNMGIEIVNRLKIRIFSHLLKMPISYFDKNSTGRLISRVDSDSTQLFMLFSSVSLEFIGSVLNISIAIFIMFTISIKYTTYIVTAIPLFLTLALLIFKNLKKLYKEDRRLYASISSFLSEHVKAIPLLKRLNAINWSRNKFAQVNNEKVNFGKKIFFREYSAYFILRIIPEFTIAWIIYNGSLDIKNNLITVGTVWLFIDYLRMAIEPLYRISEQIGQLQRGLSSADRIFDILSDNRNLEEYTSKDQTSLNFTQSIEFKDVHFSYVENKPVLKGLSFKVNKGEVVAFVAPTGAGKTTIFSILAKFYQANSGTIIIDGTNINDLDSAKWRKQLGLVWQDIKLFPGNIIDNLRVLRTDISEAKVKETIQSLGIENLINRFPKHYNTNLLEDGNNISQGEKQLLSIARTMIFNPNIILLDEATSAIDPKTEQLIQTALEKLLKGKTALIIAHRLSTIQKADKIFVMDDGKIVEQGTHDELIANDSIYASLFYSQVGTKEENSESK